MPSTVKNIFQWVLQEIDCLIIPMLLGWFIAFGCMFLFNIMEFRDCVIQYYTLHK